MGTVAGAQTTAYTCLLLWLIEAYPWGLICHQRLFTFGEGHQVTFVMLQDFFGIVIASCVYLKGNSVLLSLS